MRITIQGELRCTVYACSMFGELERDAKWRTLIFSSAINTGHTELRR